jgi:hypothetical protein
MGWFESGGIESLLVEDRSIRHALNTGDYTSLSGINGKLATQVAQAALMGGDIAEVLTNYVDSFNLVPLFDRDGMDMVFTFPEGVRRYRFVGYLSDPETNRLSHDAPVFELVRDF